MKTQSNGQYIPHNTLRQFGFPAQMTTTRLTNVSPRPQRDFRFYVLMPWRDVNPVFLPVTDSRAFSAVPWKSLPPMCSWPASSKSTSPTRSHLPPPPPNPLALHQGWYGTVWPNTAGAMLGRIQTRLKFVGKIWTIFSPDFYATFCGVVRWSQKMKWLRHALA